MASRSASGSTAGLLNRLGNADPGSRSGSSASSNPFSSFGIGGRSLSATGESRRGGGGGGGGAGGRGRFGGPGVFVGGGAPGDHLALALESAQQAIRNADSALEQNVEGQADELSRMIAETERALDALLDQWGREKSRNRELESRVEATNAVLASTVGGDNEEMVRQVQRDIERCQRQDERMDELAGTIFQLLRMLENYKATLVKVRDRQAQQIDRLRGLRERIQEAGGFIVGVPRRRR